MIDTTTKITADTPLNQPVDRRAFAAAYLAVKEQIDRRRFGVHERHVLRLVNLRSFGKGRAIAEIPYLDYFVKYSAALGAGVMARGHASIAVNKLIDKKVLHEPGKGRYMFNVLFDAWLAPLLPDGQDVLHEMDLLKEPPDLFDGLMLNFLDDCKQMILPAPGAGASPAGHPGREAQDGDGRPKAEGGAYREPAGPTGEGGAKSAELKTEAGVMSRPKVTNSVTTTQAASDAGVTKNVTPAVSASSVAAQAAENIGDSAVTKNVTLKPAAAGNPQKPAVSPQSPLLKDPLSTAEAHQLINSLSNSLAHQDDRELFLELAALACQDARGASYLKKWFLIVRDERETARRLLSEYRNACTPSAKQIANPGGWMFGTYRRWQEQRTNVR